MLEDDLKVFLKIRYPLSDVWLFSFQAVSKAEHLPGAFMVPKIDSPEDVATMYDMFRTIYGPARVTDTVSVRF